MGESAGPRGDVEAWRTRVLATGKSVDALATVTIDGPAIEPLYGPAPGLPAWTRTGPWQTAQTFVLRRVDALVHALGQAGDLELAWIDAGTRLDDGDIESVARVLAAIDPQRTAIALHVGTPLGAGEVLVAALARTRIELATLAGGCFVDPFGELVRTGGLPVAVDDALAGIVPLSRSVGGHGLRTALACGEPWHDAGASAVDELAAVVATMLAIVRAFAAAGAGADEAFAALALRVGLGGDVLVDVAKLRALRWLVLALARRLEVSASIAAVPIVACTSRCTRSRIDVDTNLVRATIEAFAGAIGGADAIAIAPHDVASASSQRFAASARWARNISHILRHEAHLDRVADPTAGSGAIEAMTESLARAAWARVQSIEAQGGLLAALLTGEPQARVAATARARIEAVADGRAPLVGVSKFAPPSDARQAVTAPEPSAVDPAGFVVKIDPLPPLALADAYERRGAP